MKKFTLSAIIVTICLQTIGQSVAPLTVPFTTAQNRTKFYNNCVASISRNLSIPLSDSSEENWVSAFSSMELIHYTNSRVTPKFKIAFADINKRSLYFQQSFLELLYANGFKGYTIEIRKLLNKTTDAKIFAICAEYLLMTDSSKVNLNYLNTILKKKITANTFEQGDRTTALLYSLDKRLKRFPKTTFTANNISPFLKSDYLKHNVIVYSIQRPNRDYPGIVIIKDTAGNFVQTETGDFFSVPQLARSESNMAGYISNGNTPQGIFRMFGLGVSKITFIGPTENIQLTMPFETSLQHFLKDSLITDTTWTPDWYKKLLPQTLRGKTSLYETYYASMAGRTEIIAHGTTIDPGFYKGQPYYPLTPTEGCLCTKEIWNAAGAREESDQQKLIDAVKKAGGADGYLIVLEIDDQQRPIALADVLPYLEPISKK